VVEVDVEVVVVVVEVEVDVEVEVVVVVVVVVEVDVVVVVEVVVLVVVVVVVVIATAIVLLIVNGLLNPSSNAPVPKTPAVADAVLGIVQGNGPKTATALSAGMSCMVTRFVHKVGSVGGTGGLPAALGQQKLAVTSKTSQPTWHPAVPGVQPGGSRLRSVTTIK
jgi:hypothetical protein